MRIALVNPPFKPEHGKFSRSSRSPAITKSGTLYHPIWLAYAAGYLELKGHEVTLIDSCATRMDLDTTGAKVDDFAPDLVVVDTSTPSIVEDVRSAARFKEGPTSPFVCLVGTHPSSLPIEVLAMDERVDCIARREYDQTLVDLAECLENKGDVSKVEGLVVRVDGKVIPTAERAYLQDLDSIPFVSQVYKKHLRIEDYFFAAGEYPEVMIMTGRGCTSRCFFCVYPQAFHGHKYRLRSAKNVADEFEWISRELPQVKSIGIEDDTFTADKKRVLDICQLLIERGIHKKLHWWANTRVSLDYETMKQMKKAGCRLMIPGLESGDQTVLNNIRKGIRLDQSAQYLADAKKANLLVHGCFMVGNKGDTRESMNKTLDFAMKAMPDTAQFFPMIPYPGTEAFGWAKENGHLKTLDYSKWLTEEGLHQCVIDLPDMKSQELVQFCDDARRKYYLRPRYMFKKLVQTITMPDERRRTLKSFRQFAKFLVK